jgi:riboflavin biosynthesis pyrimidine reductase
LDLLQEPMDLARRPAPTVRPAEPPADARPCFVVLDDHARLPWRFFGRLTAAVQAGL